jgi:hypothetical protein
MGEAAMVMTDDEHNDLQTLFDRAGRRSRNQPRWEPAEPDPGPGWLRSRFMGKPYPRPGVAPCGRASCPVCGSATASAAKALGSKDEID